MIGAFLISSSSSLSLSFSLSLSLSFFLSLSLSFCRFIIQGVFPARCNMEMVELDPIAAGSSDDEHLLTAIKEHQRRTKSEKANALIKNWDEERDNFVRVMPTEYRLSLEKMNQAKESEVQSATN